MRQKVPGKRLCVKESIENDMSLFQHNDMVSKRDAEADQEKKWQPTRSPKPVTRRELRDMLHRRITEESQDKAGDSSLTYGPTSSSSAN